MTTLEMPAATPAPPRRRSLLTDPAGRHTALAGGLLVAGSALAVGDAGGLATQLAVTGAGGVVALFALAPSARRALVRHPGLAAVTVLVLLAPFLMVAVAVVGGVLGAVNAFDWIGSLIGALLRLVPLGIVLVAGVGGLVLVADYLRAHVGSFDRPASGWQRLSASRDAAVGGPRPWRALAGLALIVLATVFGMGMAGLYFGASLFGLVIALGAGIGALVVLGALVLIAGLARADHGQLTAAREDERQRMAAHLHDSVLQTLALVQRQAHDPVAVARLARRQEHDLRAWMAGETELGDETLAAALREAAADVEADHGAVVELTILGDRPLDREGHALAAAAREALRNAARHAGSSPIFVFARADRGGAEVFIRDEGDGFELVEVPTERRGVRDAIIGRMASVGGRATVESTPGEGTEVSLRIGEPADPA